MCTNSSVIRPYRADSLPRIRKGTVPRASGRGAILILAMASTVVLALCLRAEPKSEPTPIEAPSPTVPAAESADLAVRSIAELAAWSYTGNASASFELGRRLEFGIGTPVDLSESAHWYATAEEQGHPLPRRVLERLFP